MPLLTLHRPNFCSECGAKILRLRWRLWTSRKFCDSCGRNLQKQRLINAGVLVSAVFLAGLVIGNSFRTPPPPLIIQRKEVSPSAADSPTGQQPNASIEDIYTCGARTKKGKPCSRRVHGPVRCWQHKGMKAMVEQEKLKILE